MPSNNEQFAEAANYWDLETLYGDLASAKGKRLTPVEKLHLRGLLCGCSPSEIAQKLQKSVKGVESEVCTTLYIYVKNLVGKPNDKVENWRNVGEWLEDAGYKAQAARQAQASSLLPENSVVNITNISIEKNQIVIVINLRIPTNPGSELTEGNLGLGDDTVG